MGNTGRNRLTKVRHYVTSLGCVVSAERTLNQQTGCIDETVHLSHPRPLAEVAYEANQVLEREAKLR